MKKKKKRTATSINVSFSKSDLLNIRRFLNKIAFPDNKRAGPAWKYLKQPLLRIDEALLKHDLSCELKELAEHFRRIDGSSMRLDEDDHERSVLAVAPSILIEECCDRGGKLIWLHRAGWHLYGQGKLPRIGVSSGCDEASRNRWRLLMKDIPRMYTNIFRIYCSIYWKRVQSDANFDAVEAVELDTLDAFASCDDEIMFSCEDGNFLMVASTCAAFCDWLASMLLTSSLRLRSNTDH